MSQFNAADVLRRQLEAKAQAAVAETAKQEREALREQLYQVAESAIGASVASYVSYSDGSDPRAVRLSRYLALGKAMVENKADQRLRDLPVESDEHGVAAGILKAACAGAQEELASLLGLADGAPREYQSLVWDNLRRVCAQICDPAPYGLETPLPAAPAPLAHRKTGRPKKSEKDSAAMVIAALSKHHGYSEDGGVVNFDPASNRGLATAANLLRKPGDRGLSKNALSRFLAAKLGKDGHQQYAAKCRNKTVGVLLSLWRGELPKRLAELQSHESGSEDPFEKNN